MPYVPSEDRPILDEEVKKLAQALVRITDTPMLVFDYFYTAMRQVVSVIRSLETNMNVNLTLPSQQLGAAIFNVAVKYKYQGAWLGELNYATTRLIQEIPKEMVKKGLMSTELRYWYYAEVVGYLGALTHHFQTIQNTNWIDQGFAGVFEDIKDEYKWRVNRSYEAYQILKSGDCYDTPYYTKLVKVLGTDSSQIGYIDVYVKRSDQTIKKDIIGELFIDEQNDPATSREV